MEQHQKTNVSSLSLCISLGFVASRLATVIYVAMVMPILYDNNSCIPNDSNLKYASYWLYGSLFKNCQTLTL